MQATSDDLDFKTIQQIGSCGYEPIERKGRGSYGFVYEVGDSNGHLYAFKYILPDQYYLEIGLDSLNEIDILTRVNHPHIIHAAQILTRNNCAIDGTGIVLPLADKTLYDVTLNPLITTHMKLPIIYELSTALEFMHRSHILHLDIKNTNVVLQDNTPYFIDFGLSMIVDNTQIGKSDPLLRVTIDHRPPEILSGSRIYNAAVDIWSFGIMLLQLLTGRGIFNLNINFDAITDAQFYQIVLNTFSNPYLIPNALSGIDPRYKYQCIDLLTNILQIDPTRRLTAQQICDHPLFNSVRQPIDGFLTVPPILSDYNSDHRDIIKLILHWARNLYGNERAELLFLTVDLFNRVASYYKNHTAIDRMTLAATCLWMASKLTNSRQILLSKYITDITQMVPGITVDMILGHEISVIYYSSGILNVSQLYQFCENGDELKLSYNEIIINRDSTLYARVDIPNWIITMKRYIPQNSDLTKNITINQLLS